MKAAKWWWDSNFPPLQFPALLSHRRKPPKRSSPRHDKGNQVSMEKAHSHDRRKPSTGSSSKRRNSEISGERDDKEHPPSPSAAGKSNKRRPQETTSFHHYPQQGSNRPKKQKVYAQPAPIERPASLDEPSLVSLLSSGQRRMFPPPFFSRFFLVSNNFSPV